MKETIRSAATAKIDFAKALDRLAYTGQLWKVFEDFLDYALLMFHWQDRKEEHFDDLKKRYPSQEQQELFAEALLLLGEIADNDGEGFAVRVKRILLKG